MYTESDLQPISALQHLSFCPRQWGLIHLEQLWAENVFTAEGRVLHERVHEDESETRGDVRIVRSLRIHSLRLGLAGQADVVEFHLVSGKSDAVTDVAFPGRPGCWQPYPVEYKRGKPKIDICDEVQLCAQALCLEEMLSTDIPEGAFFYGKPRRRHKIAFDERLRRETVKLCERLHELYQKKITPKAEYGKKCRSCSLYDFCRPKTMGVEKKIDLYVRRSVQAALTGKTES